jgi:antitoxin VapB
VALNIKHPEADRLARRLAERTGESLTEAVLNALRERLRREEGKTATPSLLQDLEEIRERCRRLPVLDDRPPDELIGYDESGLPT